MLTDETSKYGSRDVLDSLHTDLAGCSLFYGNYQNFTGGSSAAWTFSFAAYIGFVNFDDTAKLITELIIFRHSSADAMSHVPCSLVGDSQLSLQFLCADALLCGADQVDSEEPFSQRQVRVMKDAASGHAVLIVTWYAAIQMPFACLSGEVECVHLLTAASNAAQTLRPADALEVSKAPLFSAVLAKNLKRWKAGFS